MKITRHLPVLILLTLFLSCNNSDDNNDTMMPTDDTGEMMEEEMEEESEEEEMETPPLRYYSLTTGDTWRYDVMTDDLETTADTLTVTGTAPVGDQEYTDFEASATSTGFMTSVIAGGLLQETDSQLLFTGSILLPFEENDIEIDFPVTPVYDQTATTGTELSTFTEVVEQTVEQDGIEIPLTITATISTVQIGLDEDIAIGDFTFESVITSSITVSATISASIFGVSVVVLEEQNVLAVNNRYGQNVGLVDSTVQFNYELVDLTPFGIELPFPSSDSGQSTQIITGYEVAADN